MAFRDRRSAGRLSVESLLLKLLAGCGLLLVLELKDIRRSIGRAEQPAGEKVAASHDDVAVDGHIAVAHAWKNEHFEALVGTDKGIGNAHGVHRAYIVVHVACCEHQMPL